MKKMGANIQVEFVPDGEEPYIEMTDEEGREYVLVPCDCPLCVEPERIGLLGYNSERGRPRTN